MKLQKLRNIMGLKSWREKVAPAMAAQDKAESPVGVLLQASRLRCGEELADIAKDLRIRQNYLEALEEGRFHELPGATYAVGFVRTYAEHLGLDGNEVVRRFKAEAAGINRSMDLIFPAPKAEGGIPGGALMLVGAVLAVLAYGGWYLLSTGNRTAVELVPDLPDRFLSLVDSVRSSIGTRFGDIDAPVTVQPAPAAAIAPPAQATTAPAAAPVVEPTPTPVAAPQAAAPVVPAASAAVEAGRSQPTAVETRAAMVPSAPAVPSQPPTLPSASIPAGDRPASPVPASSSLAANLPSTGPSEEGGPQIFVRAKTDSWIQIRDELGNQLLVTRLMRAGDTYEVPNRPGLKLLTGNAGALDILIDGEATPSLGPIGAVRRDISLNAELLRAGTAARP